MTMRVGTFLVGGLVGAAAVIYFNSKSKAMLLSAFSSNNQSVGNVVDKAKDKFTNVFDNQPKNNTAGNTAANSNTAASNSASSSSGSSTANKVNKQSQADLGKAKEKDPMKANVNEMMHENHQKETHLTQ
jgi:hypothetical protein